jgi:phage baseplate assembly protein W
VSGYAWLVDTSPVPVPTTAAEEQQEQILGKGIFFDGDYRVTPHGDYLTIEQEEALKQDVYHRLITNPGEYKFRPDYGCGVRAAVNGRMGQAEIDALTNRIRENLLQDPRGDGRVRDAQRDRRRCLDRAGDRRQGQDRERVV